MDCQLTGTTIGEGMAWAFFFMSCAAAYFTAKYFEWKKWNAKRK
jgi:hypothetical protein